MQQTILTDLQAQFLREEKEALAGFQVTLAGLDLPREALDSLQKAILQLDELFLMVVAGEFNAGKSALINALLGEKVLAEGATPTTTRVTLVKWGEQASEQVVDEAFAVVTYPLPLLKELNIVDTPGTNAIIRQHERLTDEFIPRSDLVLFITSADHPLTESERQFLERILTWGKKVVFVLNKVDIFEDSSALQEVREFILKHIAQTLATNPSYSRFPPNWPSAPRRRRTPANAPGCAATAGWTTWSNSSGSAWMTAPGCSSSSTTRWVWQSTWPARPNGCWQPRPKPWMRIS